MSDFLVNLARRSAGLAPVVRARRVAAATVSDPPSGAPAENAAPLAIARTTAPIAQRAPAASPAAPTTPPAPLERAGSVAPVAPPVAPRAPIVVEGVERDRAVADANARTAAESPAVSRRSDRSPDAITPAIGPASIARIDPPQKSWHDERLREVVREDVRIIDRVIEPAASDASAPVVVTIRPAELPPLALSAPRAEPAPERTVHVRIGAIEIYGADEGTGGPAPAAAMSAPVASPASAASPVGGFDDYAALRSYAPWAW